MRKLLPLLYLLLGSIYSFAQEFTPPDTAALRKSKVKSCKIYYTGTGIKEYLSREFHYNQKGQCIFSSDGASASYYYSFRYDSAGRCNWWDQRQMNGKLIAGHESDFYPDGILFHMKFYSDIDTVFPGQLFTYDIFGNTIEEKYFSKGQLIRTTSKKFDENKGAFYVKDSTNDLVTIMSKGKLIYSATYDSIHQPIEIWQFNYDNNYRLISTTCKVKKKTTVTEIQYAKDQKLAEDLEYSLLINGKSATREQESDWKKRWDALTPKFIPCGTRDHQLPYSDPVPIMEYKHEIKKDKQGNIISDRITPNAEWMNDQPVLFTYVYEYW